MPETKFTPANLVAKQDKYSTWVQTQGRRKKENNNGGYIIAEYHGPDRFENAKLGACAPNLYEALFKLIHEIQRFDENCQKSRTELHLALNTGNEVLKTVRGE